uniref:Selenoprotein P n=1 Tax=Hippocampus comes TaxID=109280 RepID=A0A3Q2YZ98_HIPCM
MVVNHQGAHAQLLHSMLEQRLSANIALYKQEEHQPDVWQLLNGAKDDFFIYDRFECGRLTRQISLPYSIIGQGHIEGAIKDTYCNAEIPSECQVTTEEERPDAAPAVDAETGHHSQHHHGHHHHHHHQHGHHSHDPSLGHHHHGNRQMQIQSHHSLGQQASQGQSHVAPQEAQGMPVMQQP